MWIEMEFEKCTIISGFRRSDPISWCTSNKLLVEIPLASTFSSHSFSAHYAVLSGENNMRCIFTINPAITEMWNARSSKCAPQLLI